MIARENLDSPVFSIGIYSCYDQGMERAASMPGIDGAKKVLYGIGRAIESQSPRAWNERIINVINEKIIPKLTPEQLVEVAKHKKLIEGTAVALGVGISTAELVVVSVTVQKAIQWVINRRRYAEAIRRYERIRESRRQFPTEWPYVSLPKPPNQSVVKHAVPGRDEVWVNVPWKPRKKALKSFKKILEVVGVQVAIPTHKASKGEIDGFTRWAQALRREYNLKYANPAEAALLVGTLAGMIDRISWFAKKPDDRVMFRRLTHTFSSAKKNRQEHAFRQLKTLFISSFVEMQQRIGWHATTPSQAMIQQARAGELFDKWAGINLLGLPDMMGVVEPNKQVIDRVQHGMKIPLIRNFNVNGDSGIIPETIVTIVSKKGQREMLRIPAMKKKNRPIEDIIDQPGASVDMDFLTYKHGSFVHPEKYQPEFELMNSLSPEPPVDMDVPVESTTHSPVKNGFWSQVKNSNEMVKVESRGAKANIRQTPRRRNNMRPNF